MVPLAPQSIEVLDAMRRLTGHGQYVSPSLLTDERPMSDNTIRCALRRLGYTNEDMTAHGFRAMARTIMLEQMNVETDVIEAQLAHGKSGPLGAAYDRAQFVEKRRKMMNQWVLARLCRRLHPCSFMGCDIQSDPVSPRYKRSPSQTLQALHIP